MRRKLSRFMWRLRLVLKLGPGAWRMTRYLDNRPPTAREIEVGLEIAKEYDLL